MYIFASCRLREQGYEHYEVSNYGKPNYLSRHNQVYWRNQSYYGFGMSATSYTELKRFSRPRKLLSYFDWVKQLEMIQNGEVECREESLQDQAVDTLILGLRMKQGISMDEFEKQYGQQLSWQIKEAAQPWIESGHVVSTYDCNGQLQNLALQDPEGFLLQNSILISLLEKSLWNKSSSKYHKTPS
ncbi:Oxygen-independent coproporphyrinogen-III oxidase-like protein sll1917 [Galdieria sulphuraria]|nr:Oxygen-independent coproporphyrinogen-III oxidase-like protein sll1917 [Galdieria sulphuraria]